MTNKLYYTNSYLKEFSSLVLSCEKEKDNFLIVLDQTAFYPEGGGQPCDTGYFLQDDKEIKVNYVKEKNDIVYHVCDEEVIVDKEIQGFINFDRRFDLMQQHTGEHILSGIVNSVYGLTNFGFHIGESEILVDFDGPLSKEDIDNILYLSNLEIWNNNEVLAFFPENLKEITYRSKKELEGKVRLVKSGDADICACCGTHTRFTGEVGVIAIVSFMAYKGGTRISMLCGKRALSFYDSCNEELSKISKTLSLKLLKTASGVDSLLAQNASLKSDLYKKNIELFDLIAENTKVENDVIIYSYDKLSSQEVNLLAVSLHKKASTVLVYSKQDDESIKINLLSTKLDTNKIGKELTTAFMGKGGGKPGSFQGFITKDCADFTPYLNG